MAHNLAFDVNGNARMFNQGSTPWHGLGTVVDQCQTWQDVIRVAGLGYPLEKLQLISPIDNFPIPDVYGIFRTDTGECFGPVGKDYSIIPPEYCLEFVDTILEADDDAHYVSAGALGKGERIWVCAQISGEVNITGTDDKQYPYLFFATSHDGSLSATCKLSFVRPVCQNTLSQGLNSTGAFLKVRHTKNADMKMQQAKALMAGVAAQVKDIEAKFNVLATRKVSKESVADTFKRLFGDYENKNTAKTANKVQAILDRFADNDHGAIPEIGGTAYALLNAITGYVDHEASFRRTNGKENLSADTIRGENAMFGVGASLKESALEIVMEATKNDSYHQVMRRYVTAPTVTPIMPPPPTGLLDSLIDGWA